MKIVLTTGKCSPGFKHLDRQTNLADFGFISECSLEHQAKLGAYLYEKEGQKQEGIKV